MWIHHRYVQVRRVEGQVIVPAVPQYDVGFLLRFAEDPSIVNASVHNGASIYVRLVFLSLLYCGLVTIQVLIRRKTLADLLGQRSVGHWVTDDHHFLAYASQDIKHAARGLALAGAGTRRTDTDHRHPGL